MVLGLRTLDLAEIHGVALAALAPGRVGKGLPQRAEFFLSEATTPIMETDRAGRRNQQQWRRLNAKLNRRTLQLAVSKRRLQRVMVRRKNVEAALKSSGERFRKLLTDSLRLQESLRQVTHQVLSTQEEERKNMSRELHDEIGQTLLGINVRLLSLKGEARSNTKVLQDDITRTQQLVARSAKSVRKVVRQTSRA
jgi:signal transduction histidine kinase